MGFTEFRTAALTARLLADDGWTLALGGDAMDSAARLGVPEPEELAAAYQYALDHGASPDHIAPMRGGLTAVVATLAGDRPGPTRALRFDLDALPLTESNAPNHRPSVESFASTRPGLMHACGHDGHVAIGIELGRRLADHHFPGVVKLIFQPAEEGGRGGAAVAASGVLDDVDSLVCLHLGMGLPSGQLAAAAAGLLANTKLRARFTGAASHAAAAPQDGRHALLGAATAVLNVHALPDFAGADTRINVGHLISGTSSNIIPDEALMLLETRADDDAINNELTARVRRVLAGAADMYGLGLAVDVVGQVRGAPCSPSTVTEVTAAMSGILQPAPPHYLGASDDATALMRAVQTRGGSATYCIAGADLAGPHHTPLFDFDEGALADATAVLESYIRRTADG